MTSDEATAISTVNEEEDVTDTQSDDVCQHSLASFRYRVSQGEDRFSVSGPRLVHDHRGQHLHSDERSRRFYSVDGAIE